jgi:hypothetical protein
MDVLSRAVPCPSNFRLFHPLSHPSIHLSITNTYTKCELKAAAFLGPEDMTENKTDGCCCPGVHIQWGMMEIY